MVIKTFDFPELNLYKMKSVKIINKKSAINLIHKLINNSPLCYYLTNDYVHFVELQEKLSDKIKVNNLSGLLQQAYQEIKDPFLELMSRLNKENDSPEWWGGQLASKNIESTPLFLNITYLFCAKKILADSKNKDILFIVNSRALSECISSAAEKAGYRVENHRNRINELVETIKHWAYIFAQLFFYFLQVIKSRRAAITLLKPLPAQKISVGKRIVLRSWVTKGNFNEAGKNKDRNFGNLPAWLRSKNYEVWHLPMFFDLPMSIKEVYAFMKDLDQPFLIPDHYVKFTDYVKVICNGFQMLRNRIQNADIRNTNVVPILNEALKKLGLNPTLLILNLCVPMLQRLKEKGFEIDGFYYSFEGNPPEKPFILACKKFFSDSKVLGFQHTAFFPNQLAHHLGVGEKDYHPLPDQLVCSGPIYVELYQKAGFPSEILFRGPNLRFESVYLDVNGVGRKLPEGKKNIILPLTFSHDLAFELFVKVRDALQNNGDYTVYIRTHPLLSKKSLIRFLGKIGLNHYEFADEGIIQEWLPNMSAVVSTGASITILESVVMGVPVIRVVPDNTFFYDPFIWPDYPLKPVNSPPEISEQFQLIEKLLHDDKEMFRRIGKLVLPEYFSKPTEENMKVFL